MPLTKEAQALLDEFAKQPGVTQDNADNLSRVINGSPALVDQVNTAVRDGHLKHIVPLPIGTHAGGEYNGTDKEMRLPLSVLTSPPQGVPFDAGEPTFVLGHELQHGFNHAATEQATQAFLNDAKYVAQSDAAAHDYTSPIGALIAANRRDEAGAEVAGWNALVGMVKTGNSNATLGDIYGASPYRASDFIDRTGSPPNYQYSPKPNLTLDSDLQLQATAANIEGMGKNYFDHPPAAARLGHNGNSDYTNYYGAWATSVAIQSERVYGDGHAQLQMNMGKLHLSESLMEQNGIDLGNDTTRAAYVDTSTTPPSQHHFDHTVGSYKYVPVAFSGIALPSSHAIGGAEQTTHPDHALYTQIESGMLANGYSRGDDTSRISHSLLALAKQNGLERADHVVLSQAGNGQDATNVFLVEGQLNDPAHRRVSMDLQQALQTPQTESLQQVDAINQAQGHDVAMQVQSDQRTTTMH